MNIQEAVFVARSIMLASGLRVLYRGVPKHIIKDEMSKDNGKYSPAWHLVITGPEWTMNTIVHEAVHSLQYPEPIPLECKQSYQAYMDHPPEKEAFFVAAMAEYGIKVEKGDLKRWNKGKPTGSLKRRIDEMINRKYRR